MHKVVFVISGSKKLWNWKSLLTLFQLGEGGETLTLFQRRERGETVTADKIVMKVVFTFSGTQKTVELENHC